MTHGLTLDEAANILGCSRSNVRRFVLAGRLAAGDRYRHRQISCVDAERLALEVYDWRRHRDDPAPYWVTGQRAAEVLGVNRARLDQLSRAGRVPYEVHRDGVRLYRRRQLQTVANARAVMLPRR